MKCRKTRTKLGVVYHCRDGKQDNCVLCAWVLFPELKERKYRDNNLRKIQRAPFSYTYDLTKAHISITNKLWTSVSNWNYFGSARYRDELSCNSKCLFERVRVLSLRNSARIVVIFLSVLGKAGGKLTRDEWRGWIARVTFSSPTMLPTTRALILRSTLSSVGL